MSQINPFIGSILQTPAAQRQAAADRAKQARRSADSARNAYLTEDRLELSVENTDHTERSGDEPQQQRQPRQQRENADADEEVGDDADHLDIKA